MSMNKYRAVKIELEASCEVMTIQNGDLWQTATRNLQRWARKNPSRRVEYRVHFSNGRVFAGHIMPSYGDVLNVSEHMRQFCEFYALRRVPDQGAFDVKRLQCHIRISFSRQHASAIEWLNLYEIGTPQFLEEADTLRSHTCEDDHGMTITPTPMTPSWT
jgi:hypothetical protein